MAEPAIVQSQHKPRSYVSKACDRCRNRRRRCNGAEPCCDSCRRVGASCSWTASDHRTRINKAAREHEIASLETELQQARALIQSLKGVDSDQATEILARLRGDPEAVLLSKTMPAIIAGPLSIPHYTAETSSGSSSPNAPEIDLPPRDVLYLSAKRFLDTVGGVFYLTEINELDELFDRVYNPKLPLTPALAAHLFALAACGKLYDPDYLHNKSWHTYYRAAAMYANDCVTMSQLPAMQTFALLAFHDIIEKRNSAKLFIGSGLRLARDSTWDHGMSAKDRQRKAQIYHLLVLMESWAAASCGYEPDLKEAEIETVRQGIIDPLQTNPAIEFPARTLMVQVGLLKVDAIRDVHLNRNVGNHLSNVDKHMTKLDAWRQALPDYMGLATLINPSPDAPFEIFTACMLVVHSFWLSAVISLHRRVVVALAQWHVNRKWELESAPEEVLSYLKAPVDAAHTFIRIYLLLGYGNPVKCPLHVRCWLVGFNMIDSTSLLLYSATQQLLRDPHANVEEDISRIEEAFQMLHCTLRCDHVSRKMARKLMPVAKLVKDVYQARQTAVKVSPDVASNGQMSLGDSDGKIHGICEDALPLARRVLEILKNPFPHDEGMTLTKRDADNWWLTEEA